MSKDEAKAVITKLVEKYEIAKTSNLISKYTEEETKKDFILPLFKSLGWDVDNKKEVTAEEHQSSGRVDYGFYSESRLKFYLEAKTLSANLHKEEFANQAVRYSWNKGATWAILTDFESIIVFNAQDIERSLADKLFFEIPYTQYLERFDQLWLLSKDSFAENLLDKEAEKVGKKFQKIAVSTLLYKDLDKCREILTHDLSQWNPNVDKDLLDEGVQKLLDRLIFLRVAEDRNIEPPTLIPLIRDWENKGRKGGLYESMIQKFRELDPIYDSGLFSEHPFEKWEEYSGATQKVINILYGQKGYYEYDFKAIPADVLGGVYENYLGYCLQKSKKGMSIGKDAKKRKEHGIYYTPSFIVDYIVENTLKPVLDKCTSIEDLKKIKVLDPACGSGSFLIKAFETIYNKYLEFGNNGGVYTKIDIILNNIYGVDLDPQAVEIARLNLLINALDQRMTLPNLNKNIKNGNSLISGTDEELIKYFGKDFRDKKPFNWQEEFPEVFKQGGFDVIIGNPPYTLELSTVDKTYLKYKFKSLHFKINLFASFIEQGFNLCRYGGRFSFIVPNLLFTNDSLTQTRYLLVKNTKIETLINCGDGVFDKVSMPTMIFVIEKVNGQNNNINVYPNAGNNLILKLPISISQNKFLSNQNYAFEMYDKKTSSILSKLVDNDTLDSVLLINQGIITGNDSDYLTTKYQDGLNCKTTIRGKDIGRYQTNYPGIFVKYNRKELACPRTEDIFDVEEKLLLRRTGDYPIASFDKCHTYNLHTLYSCRNISKFSIKYLLGIINSKFIKFLYQSKLSTEVNRTFAEVKIVYLRQLPIPNIDINNPEDKENYDQLVINVQKILVLYDLLKNIEKNSEKWKDIKSEIEMTDKKIDEEVYKLYGLTEEEVKIVEESTK